MDTNAISREAIHGRAYIHRIAAEPVQFRYDEHIARFKSIYQSSKLRTLARWL